MRKLILGFIVMLPLAGCKIGPDYETPAFDQMDKWQNAPQEQQGKKKKLKETVWWENYKDPILNSLIKQALESNYDIKVACMRIEQARAHLLKSESNLFPQLDSSGFISRNKILPKIQGNLPLAPFATINYDFKWSQYFNLYFAQLSAGWEADLFGRVRREIEATGATVQAEIEDMYGVLLSLTADVASSYIRLRSFQQQLAIKERALESWKSLYDLNSSLFAAGVETGIDVETIKASRERAASELNDLQTQIKTTIHHLSILLGKSPTCLYTLLLPPKPIPNLPAKIFAGLPSELLKRRPDIKAAERKLAAATAEIGMAEGKLLPSFALTGEMSGLLLTTRPYFRFQDLLYSFVPGFNWSIFNFPYIKAQIDGAFSSRDGRLYEYKNTILKALEEVENTLVTYANEGKKYKELVDSYTASKVSTNLTTVRYKHGLTNFMTVIESEMKTQTNEMLLLESQTSLALDSVLLYKVLGGGVQCKPSKQ